MNASAPEKKCFVKIVAIGDSGVGKTSVIQMFEHSRFTDNFKPTIGADFSNHLYNSKGVMTGLGQGSDAAYFEKGNMAKEGFGGVPKDAVNTKRFFFESVNPMNPQEPRATQA